MAGTVVTTVTKNGSEKIYTMTWTADASNASIPTALTPDMKGFIFLFLTNPGATAPTALYDITLTDSDGIDVAGGELLNRSATLSEQAVPKIGAIYGERYVDGNLTLNLTNNSVNSATGTVKIHVRD